MQTMSAAEKTAVDAAGAGHPVIDFFLRHVNPADKATVEAAIKGGFPWSQILQMFLTMGLPALIQILQQWLAGLHPVPTPPSPLPPVPVPTPPKP